MGARVGLREKGLQNYGESRGESRCKGRQLELVS